jgi:transcriptional regulator with XRE-family HTH domain
MNNRIIETRKAVDLTQEEFAKRIGLSRNFIWMIEKGERIPSDRTIKDICEKFNVSEKWLRTGEGEMFIQLSRDAQITKFVGEALRGESPTDQQRFLNALLGATPEELHAIAEFAKRLAAEYAKEKRDGQ